MSSIPPVIWQGSISRTPVGTISYVRAWRLIATSYLGYLAHVRDVSAEDPSVDLLLLVCVYDYVFPADLPRLPPKRDVDFANDVEPRTKPISISPYWMALVKLEELLFKL